jgi:poly-gamma-glutamate capsule biosynthesis protein CapA/YwtB (metallophosphatase superfamily)
MYPKYRTRLLVVAAATSLAVVAGCSSGSGGSGSGGSGSGGSGSAGAKATGTSDAGLPTPTVRADLGQSFTLVATGDVLLHLPLVEQAERDAEHTGRGKIDFRPMMASVQPYVSNADLGICHMETPLGRPDGPFQGYPSFSGPPQVLSALKVAGYDLCSTASNHTFDKGAAGVERTLNALDAAGIAHAGSARTLAESRKITQVKANGVRVAFLSYAFGFNGNSRHGAEAYQGNVIKKSRILADAKRARAQGAQVVVLAMHWGTEYLQKPNAEQLALAPALAKSGVIDLIISHHAHVVEPVQKIGKTWVVYGLGNMIANHSTPGATNSEGLLVRFTFTKSKGKRFNATKAEFVPLLMTDKPPLRLMDVPHALKTGKYGTTSKKRLQAAFKRTSGVVRSRGGTKSGLVVADYP